MPESKLLLSTPSESMDGRSSRNFGLGFPYDRCVPKASRSSRARGDSAKKSNDRNDQPKDMCFFELLATVAGQLLQDQQKEETPVGKSKANTKTPVASLASPEKEMQECIGTNEVENNEQSDTKTEEKLSGSADVDPSLELRSKLLPKAEVVHHEPSAISCLDHSDVVMPQEFESKALVTPIKAYSSRKRKNSEANSSPSQKVSANMVPAGVPIIKSESTETLTSKENEFPPMTDPNNAPTMPACCPVECIEDNKILEKHDLNQMCPPTQLDLLLCSSFPVAADSPPLVSSGSSEETPFPDSTHIFESSRQSSGGRPNFFCAKGRDDDGNSSESTIPKLALPKSTSLSYVKALQARKSSNNLANKRDVTGVYKRKRQHIKEEGKSRAWRKAPKIKNDTVQKTNSTPADMIVEAGHDGSPTKTEKGNVDEMGSSPAVTSPKKSVDSHVKLSIKSFMVPELMVDLPESATVANLKKAVMEAAMNLLGGGLCVRVLLQGQKVADETKSLLQAGIANDGKLDSLGFMLEPNTVPTPSTIEDAYLVLSHGSNQTSRYPVLSKGSEMNTSSLHVGAPEIDANSSGTEIQSTTGSPSKNDTLMHESPNGVIIPGSCALILHPNQVNHGANGLAVVPYGQNQSNSSMNKRRMRRPFTVAEVEVLVQAVEKLGTGRWRDVKLHAFPQAKHRTYVDLKDKWKTLVHTASIAPHQRRGEPVPQGLLDRVIQAHSYWTAQQAKQQSIETKVF